MKFIPTIVHGGLDYLTGVALLFLPRILNLSSGVAGFVMAMGAAALVYSLITRYELGAFKVMPMPAHLALDFVSGLAFLGAALFFAGEPGWVRGMLVGIGLFEIAAAAFTNPTPYAVGERADVPSPPGTRRTRDPGLR